MNTFLIFCGILVVRIHAEFVSPFPMQYDQIVDDCRNKTGYTDEVVAEEEKTFYAENKGLRIFNYCFLEKTGFVTSDGKLNIDDAVADVDPSLLKDSVDFCKSLEEIYPKSVFSTCFHSNIVTYKRFFEIEKVVKSQRKDFKKILTTCRNETEYTDELIITELQSHLEEREGNNKFNKCILEKTGFGASDELFFIDDAITRIPADNVTEIFEYCTANITDDQFPESIPFISGCVHLGVSNYFRSTQSKLVLHYETDQIVDAIYDCQEKNGYREVLKNGSTEENFTEKEALKKSNDCFLKQNGFITSDGKLNIDTALEKLPPSFVKAIVEHCQANIALNYTTDSVDNFSSCYHDGILNHIFATEEEGYFPFVLTWKFCARYFFCRYNFNLLSCGTKFYRTLLILPNVINLNLQTVDLF